MDHLLSKEKEKRKQVVKKLSKFYLVLKDRKRLQVVL